MTDTFNFPYKQAHVASVEFNTIIDGTFTGGEQRRDIWTNPRKSWILDFEKDQTDWNALMTFFINERGRKNAFYWTWDSTKGGDGVQYLVKFDTDKLDLSVLEMGYATFSIKIVQVVA